MKKSFKDNPALQFISSAGTEEIHEQDQQISPQATDPARTAPEGYKINPKFIELKSKRLQLVLQPSLLARVKERAKAQKLSVNEYVHRILDEATREE